MTISSRVEATTILCNSNVIFLRFRRPPKSTQGRASAASNVYKRQALEKVQELRKRYENISIQDQGKRFNTDLLEAIELGFLLDLAEVTVIACRERRESRGAHLREDYTERDDKNFMVHSMVYKQEKIEKNTGTNMRIGWKPVVVTNYQPMERKY